jgi:hypothetical protein
LRSLPLAFAAVAFMASCKHPGSAKLEGHWKGQHAEGIPAEAQVNANVFATGSEIVARGNQISITTPAAKNVTATYFVDKEDASTLVIHTDKDTTSETFVFKDAKTMAWKVDERRTIVFKKID